MLKNIFSQWYKYVLWALLSLFFWGWIFTLLTDARPAQKLVLCVDRPELRSEALADALSADKPEGIKLVAVHAFDYYIFDTEELRCAQLRTLPVSERLADIQSLVGLCINTFNVQFGTQLVGLSAPAMLCIQNHRWAHNIDQLVQFMSRLVAGSTSAYVSEEEVMRLLSAEKKPEKNAPSPGLDLHRPLSEIERELVRAVYLEEGMNQTRTAERLGISRSTVWRMLRE